MSQVAYKWIAVLVALMVVPGTLISPPTYARVGTAGGCMLGNIITGCVTSALLVIGLQTPSNALFGVFITILYVGFPFTVISQLSTGPMLDCIAPPEKRGSIQGLNSMTMNFSIALAPWLLGLFADGVSTTAAIASCIGISFLAVLVNLPLMWKKGLGPPTKQTGAESKPLKFENKELVEKILNGDWVPPAALDELNEGRRIKGRPFLLQHPGTFADDRERLGELRNQAKADYAYTLSKIQKDVGDINTREDLGALCESVNKAFNSIDPEGKAEVEAALGAWFVDWLKYSGYRAHNAPQLFKQMIMTSFPVLTRDEDFTPENLEPVMLEYMRVIRTHSQIEVGAESYGNRISKILSTRRGF